MPNFAFLLAVVAAIFIVYGRLGIHLLRAQNASR